MPSLAEILPDKQINKLKEIGRKGDLLKEVQGNAQLAEILEEVRSADRLPMVPPSKKGTRGISVRVMAQKATNRNG
ncbi:hypothetical protein A2115_02875 [Candidatus Woesebacteria bacterium GWA1_41_8]|uniref:Uncharacterized protein n=1 Tax=Candidatus Woesebacteria bacterium GWA1_41_8 TaxID=1802471 RepID=A0A1F7WHV3_9BACT|nr:MAG: hypothetical protein A2115_02875 [Candidatus Woesebacteria bacterium GWA1_41_8]